MLDGVLEELVVGIPECELGEGLDDESGRELVDILDGAVEGSLYDALNSVNKDVLDTASPMALSWMLRE